MRQKTLISERRTAAILMLLVFAAPSFGADDDEKKKPDLPLEGQTGTLAFSTDEGSWLSIDVMPDGETLVFDLLGDLYTLPINGGKATRINKPKRSCLQAQCSSAISLRSRMLLGNPDQATAHA